MISKLQTLTGLSFLKEIVEVTLLSAYVKNERPLSTLIVASPEHGKTEHLLQYAGNKGIEIVQDVTSFGLVQHIFPRVLSQEIKHIIFPSFEKIFTRSKLTVHQVLTCINNIVEEGIGIGSIFTWNITFPSQGKVARAGVVIGCVPKLIQEHKNILEKYGFWSRMLPISYTYAPEDLKQVHEEIKLGINPFSPIKLKFPKPTKVLLPKDIADKFDNLVKILKIPTGSYTGFRLRRILQTYAKASALRKGKKEVNEDEVRDVYSISPFIFQPFAGDECCWKIIKAISTKPQSIKELTELTGYSEKTVYRRVKILRKEKLVKLEKSMVYPIISLSQK